MTTDRKIFDFLPRRGIMAEIEYPGVVQLIERVVWERVAPPSSRKIPWPQSLDTPAIQAFPPQVEVVKKTAWPHVWPHLAQNSITKNPGLAQLVARLLWEQDVGSSSLPSRTTAPEIEWFQGLLFYSLSIAVRKLMSLFLHYICRKSELFIVNFIGL